MGMERGGAECVARKGSEEPPGRRRRGGEAKEIEVEAVAGRSRERVKVGFVGRAQLAGDHRRAAGIKTERARLRQVGEAEARSGEHTAELQQRAYVVCRLQVERRGV